MGRNIAHYFSTVPCLLSKSCRVVDDFTRPDPFDASRFDTRRMATLVVSEVKMGGSTKSFHPRYAPSAGSVEVHRREIAEHNHRFFTMLNGAIQYLKTLRLPRGRTVRLEFTEETIGVGGTPVGNSYCGVLVIEDRYGVAGIKLGIGRLESDSYSMETF